jgi:hypothetical protein
MAFSIPPIPDSEVGNLPTLLFGPGTHQTDRYVDPEVQGGKIALLADTQKGAQKPPNSLDRMQSTYSKQVAYNQRIMKAEDEISGINCDIADFVSQMSLDPAEEVIICVNGTQEMKKGETAMAGQLWIQGDRMMTAANPAFPGMSNSKESAILSATAEALEWRNDALEQPDPPRKGQRVILYPKDLWGLEEVLANGDPNVESEHGHEIAYQRIFAAAEQFESTPTFLKEDCESILSDPKKAELVPQWMCLAERAAIGSRPRVLEDGPDTPNSDDEAKEDVKPDKLTGMYTPEMDPKLGPKKLSPSEVSQQKAAAQARKESVSSSSSRFTTSSTPEVSSDFGNSIVNSSQSSEVEDEDWSWMTPGERKKAEIAARALKDKPVQPPRCLSAPGARPPKRQPAKSQPASEPKGNGTPASRSRDDAGPSQKVPQPSDLKAAASQRAPAGRSSSGQASPGTKVPTPTKGSRAGGFQGVGGSGQKDTCMPPRHASQTGVVIFPSAEVSSHT